MLQLLSTVELPLRYSVDYIRAPAVISKLLKGYLLLLVKAGGRATRAGRGRQAGRYPIQSQVTLRCVHMLLLQLAIHCLNACLFCSVPPLFSCYPISKKLLQYLSHRMFTVHAWSIKYRWKKLIVQFDEKLRDERFEPN